jgi:hypothetical protein
MFSNIFEPFLAHLAREFSKSANMAFQKKSWETSNAYTEFFMLIPHPIAETQ